MAIIPRDYQRTAIDATFKYFENGGIGNPLVLMPQGCGKSVVIAQFVKEAISQFSGTRILMLTHVKELISQNFAKLLDVWPNAPAGIYSAGLGAKDAFYPITFGGVSSVAKCKNIVIFGKIDLLLIDECHLVSPNDATEYNRVIKQLKKLNPYLKVIGYTATDFRLGHGRLTENDHLFTDVAINMCTLEGFNWFFDQGYLARLIPKRTKLQVDSSKIHMKQGEFVESEAQAIMDKHEVSWQAIHEMLEEGVNRKCWLVFAQGVNHTEHVWQMMLDLGINATYVHSKMPKKIRDANIADFKAGKYLAMVNSGILTTGFDCPQIDLLAVLRLTQSPGLWTQILGRATRPNYAEGFDLSTQTGRLSAIAASDKPNALVLDFAGNTKRLGPINDPVIPKYKGTGGGGVAPVKVCEVCMTYNHASVRYCTQCGTEFIAAVKITNYAGTDELIASNEVKELESTIFTVDKVTYKRHKGRNSAIDSLKVSYYCGIRMFSEYICLEHAVGNYANNRARNWWRDSTGKSIKPPLTIAEALERLNEVRQARRIRVLVKETNSEIINYEY